MLVAFARQYALAVSLSATVVAVALVAVGWEIGGPPPASATAGLLSLDLVRLQPDGMRVELMSGASEARYRAQEVLSGRGANEAVGRTTSVLGGILLDQQDGVLVDQSRISVDLTTLRSDNEMRDRYIQRATLQTAQYPMAEFQVLEAPGLPLPLPTSGTVAFTLVGDLTVHGVTRPTTWEASVTFADGEVHGTAGTTVLLTDFGMEPPYAGPVLSIDDAVRLEIDVRGTIAPPPDDLLIEPT